MPKKQLLVYVPPHPLVKHYLNMARNEVTPTSLFRGAIAELGRILLADGWEHQPQRRLWKIEYTDPKPVEQLHTRPRQHMAG